MKGDVMATNAKEAGWSVGDAVYISGGKTGLAGEVVSIARRWVTVRSGDFVGRFAFDTREADPKGDFARYAKMWQSVDEKQAAEKSAADAIELDKRWRIFRTSLGWQPPKGFALADMDALEIAAWRTP